MPDIILSVQSLTKNFTIRSAASLFGHKQILRAVNDISFEVARGETLALVGESGCGKSTTGRMIIRLIDPTSGKIVFNGQDITSFKGKQLKAVRKKIQMVLQDPYASLNPRMNISANVGEPLVIHGLVSNTKERDALVRELLSEVGLDPDYASRYPFEFSGGQRQRIGIARALSLSPEIIIADEPVSALDVSLQAQIINLMKELRDKKGLTYIFIAHDLAVVRHLANRVAVMYLGKIFEIADKKEIFDNPLHPYTKALFSSIPIPDPTKRRKKAPLQGDVPSPISPPQGCLFHTRCSFAKERCSIEEPKLIEASAGHKVACHFYFFIEKSMQI
jgi:oligopeptide transport system ATP-binding protein